LSLTVAFLLSRPLQSEITEPLDAMAKIAREIVNRRDYSLRAQKTSEDEIGIVVDAFNSMLTEVEARSRALEQSNRALTEEIAARESTQAALRLATARLESTMAAAEIGSWQWDVRSNDFTADRNLAALYGLDDERALNGSPHLQHRYIHPDDLGAVRRAEHNALRLGVFEPTEFRVKLANGVERWVARRGRVQMGENGRAVFISGLIIDVSAQKRAEQALREADRRKDEFLATLAHELRNPLAPIRHAVKLLESSSVEPLRQQWSRDVISRQVHRMALLLDDLLDVSRITQGRLVLKVETVSLASIVDTAVETARPLLESKRHELEIELPGSSIFLTVDPLRLSQSLSNLLTNSAKYTDAGGHIALSVVVLPEEIVLSVKDNGIGFEPAALPKLFEMFSQVDSAVARSEGGLGIGLALVKGLIELHHGHIEAYSEGPGRGSEFRIHLPRSAAAAAPAREPIAPETRSANAGFRVLVVDDNRDAADSLAMLLEMNGHDVSVAHNGEQALRLAEQVRPKAMILDIGMPDMSGYEVARRIRAQSWGADIYLTAVTGWGQKEDKARALAAGFDHHLTKPVDPDQVEACLQAFARHGRGTPS
jgi:PAS domain S-box-containing protein